MYEQDRIPLSVSARSNFVKKVYSILLIQLAATFSMIFLHHTFPAFARFQYRNFWTYIVSFLVTIASIVALAWGKISKTTPINYYVLGIFTLAESYSVTYICGLYTPDSVLMAVAATLAATIGLTHYAATTSNDLTKLNESIKGVGYSLGWIVLTISLINIFWLKSSLIVTGIAALFAVVYSVYLVGDTQLILGGRHKSISMDDYIMGSVFLYLDIISLFLKILQLFGKRKDD